MTISLEEHVARAIWIDESPDRPWDKVSSLAHRDYLSLARAAIAAVREREGVDYNPALVAQVLEADSKPPEATFKNVDDMMAYLDAPDPAEAMRANVDVEAALDVWFGPSWRLRSSKASDAAKHFEVMQAAIAAALKGNGEG